MTPLCGYQASCYLARGLSGPSEYLRIRRKWLLSLVVDHCLPGKIFLLKNIILVHNSIGNSHHLILVSSHELVRHLASSHEALIHEQTLLLFPRFRLERAGTSRCQFIKTLQENWTLIMDIAQWTNLLT